MATAKEKREERAARIAQQQAAGVPTETERLNEAAIKNPTAVPAAHGQVAKPSRSGATVTVACKLGVPGIDLQLCQIDDKFEQNMQGGRTIKQSTRIGKVVRLRGTAYPRGTLPEGFPERPLIVGGAAMNPGIDKEWFDEWLKQNALNPLVMNKMIFAHENADHVAGQAKEQVANQSGLEPVNPKKDSRTPKPTRSEVGEVEDGSTARKSAAA